MNVGSTSTTRTSLSWCPECDLPLRRRVSTLAGTVTWKTTEGRPIDRCPRCLHWLPTIRPEFVAEMNALLEEAGEPQTCAEELERFDAWTRERSL